MRLDGERHGDGPSQRGQQEAAAVHAGMVGRMTVKINQCIMLASAVSSATARTTRTR
jgi:hypothetical protein